MKKLLILIVVGSNKGHYLKQKTMKTKFSLSAIIQEVLSSMEPVDCGQAIQSLIKYTEGEDIVPSNYHALVVYEMFKADVLKQVESYKLASSIRTGKKYNK